MVSTAFSRSEDDPDWLLIGITVPGEVVPGNGEPNKAKESRELVRRRSFRRCHRKSN